MKAVAAIVLLVAVPAAGWTYVAVRNDPDEAAAHVERVVDGDTLIVRTRKARDRVRVLGIDAPELRECGGDSARSAARRLAEGRNVRLRIDTSQPRRDRFGRLLAYVELPGGQDLGEKMLRGGHAEVLVVGRPFERFDEYRRAEASNLAGPDGC